MAVSKIVFDNKTLINLEQDTITADRALSPYTMHLADGTTTTGTIPTVSVASPTVSKSISGNVGTITSAINQPYGFTIGDNKTGGSATVTLMAATTTTTASTNATSLTFNNLQHEPYTFYLDLHSSFTISTKQSAGKSYILNISLDNPNEPLEVIAVQITGGGGNTNLAFSPSTAASYQYTNNSLHVDLTSNGTAFYNGTYELTYFYLV